MPLEPSRLEGAVSPVESLSLIAMRRRHDREREHEQELDKNPRLWIWPYRTSLSDDNSTDGVWPSTYLMALDRGGFVGSNVLPRCGQCRKQRQMHDFRGGSKL